MSVSERPIIPFTQFVQSLRAARAEHFLNVPTSNMADESAFNEMRAHLTNYYDNVTCAHSFVDVNGSVFDCIPVEQQISRRGQSGAIPTAPDLPAAVAQTAAPPPPAGQLLQLHPDLRDPFSNQMLAPDGTIPVRRMTLEDMSRFRTLRHYMQKSPRNGGGLPPPGAAGRSAPQVAATHRWAHAYENVGNLGGASYVNVWDPQIGANQIFSLAQHWYVGGSGSRLQTAEVGWQVYPGLYQNTKPCLFIYWTADDYQSTGCYNLTCSAFVQTNKNWALGGALSPWSVAGGAQYELFIAYYLVGGNWWLYLGGGAASNTVGYYPTSIYRGGAMASHASEIDYGGEVVGTTSWPPMGGGAYAAAGWQHAAYQRQIQYFPTGGGRTNASLTPSANAPCYTSLVVNYAAPWNETVWFGGPGGTNC
jgi:Neprosin